MSGSVGTPIHIPRGACSIDGIAHGLPHRPRVGKSDGKLAIFCQRCGMRMQVMATATLTQTTKETTR